MPRRLRYFLSGIPQHVLQCGNNGQPAFFSEADYRFYLACLKDAAITHACDVHAYALLSDQAQLLLTPRAAGGISRLMQSLGSSYGQYFNTVHHRHGTLWENRYRASLVDPTNYVLCCYVYTELRPVCAGLVCRPQEYPWSSCRGHVGIALDRLIIDHPCFRSLGNTETSRRTAYLKMLAHGLDAGLAERIARAMSCCRVLGEARFEEEIERLLARRIRPGQRGRPRKEIAAD
jgi:putative transposase